ncbi:MAG: hypothetical protein IKK11_00900 [Oscillospiraceae bacterium]|nr:hypothetical protein [Oscillospiraceae bacterium]
MAEYIELEELKKVLSNEAVHCLTFQKKGEARGLVKAKEIVSKLPAADVVEVVRCKDCIHWGGEYDTNECSLITQLANPDYWLKTAPDDFCSSGVRKDEKDDHLHSRSDQ